MMKSKLGRPIRHFLEELPLLAGSLQLLDFFSGSISLVARTSEVESSR
jgi:hypothetical protein